MHKQKTAVEVIQEAVGRQFIDEAARAASFPSPQNPSAFLGALGVTLWSTVPEFGGKDLLSKVLGHVMAPPGERRFTAVESGHGVGKCQPTTELILLADGSKVPAGELVGRQFDILGFDPATWQMRPMRAYAEANGQKRIYKIITKTGRIIERTGNHPLLTWDGWRTVDSLDRGDDIAIPLRLPIEANGQKLCDDDVKLLAYFIAEGSLKFKNQVGFSQAPGLVLDEFRQIIERKGCQLRQTISNPYDYNVVGYLKGKGQKQKPNTVLEFVRHHKLSGLGSWDKYVPQEIFESTNDQIILFLNRLYACDGWVTSNPKRGRIEIGYCSSSFQLVQDVFLLLLRFGIVGRMRKKIIKKYDTHAWEVFIVDCDNVKRFLEIVGFPLGKENQAKLTYEYASERSNSNKPYSSDYDLLPRSAWDKLEHKRYKHDGLYSGQVRFRRRVWTKPSRMMVKRYEEAMNTSLWNGWADSDIGWDTIKSIEFVGEKETVAICVPETQAYVTSVIDHNSLLASAIACLWMARHGAEAGVVTLAPTHSQVQNVIWRYIREMHRRAGGEGGALPGTVYETPRWECVWPGGGTSFGIGLSPRRASAEDVQALHGYHKPKLLVILDEAPGLPRLLWDAVGGLVTAEGNRILALGNPVGQAGPFWEACNSPEWNHVRISCLDHPNVTLGREAIPGATGRSWVAEMVARHCVRCGPAEPGAFEWEGEWWLPDATFESRVLGRAPTEATDQLIALAWVVGAQTWEAEPDERERAVLGMDPSRVAHGDAAALVARRGGQVMWVKRRRPRSRNPGKELAGWLFDEWRGLGAARAFVEETGVGTTVVDHARGLGVPVMAVQPGAGASTRQWANKRAECWWRLREALQGGSLSLPQDDMLEADLCAPKFWYDGSGRVILEPKRDVKARLGRSPDSGDALATTFAVADRRAKSSVGGEKTARELGQASRWGKVGKVPGRRGRWRKLG